MTPKIVNKEVKKQEILKAAMRVFAHNGVVKTKMTDIAEAAGIGKGTIYEYFRSKEDIFTEAYNLVFLGIEVKIGEVLESDIGSEEKLKMLMKVSAEGFLGNGGEFAGIMMEFWSEGIRNKDEKMIEIINMQKMYSEYRGMIAQILEEGMSRGIFRKIDTFMTASVLIGAMDGILLQWIMDPKIFTPQNAVEVLVDSYVNGIKK
jgi:AcrR family transcriptional regulator